MSVYGTDIKDNVYGAGPGVRLTQAQSDMTRDDRLASAVPVFIGWADIGSTDSAEGVLHSLISPADFPAKAEYWPASLKNSLRHYFDNGGGPCWLYVGQSPAAVSSSSLENFQQWWDKFLTNATTVLLGHMSLTLVAVPQLVRELDIIQDTSPDKIAQGLVEAWKALLFAFSSRPDLFFVLDVPAQTELAYLCITKWRNDATKDTTLAKVDQHAALYGPHLVTDYPLSKDADIARVDGFCILPPCAAVLGVYARTDASSGVWKAPANEVLVHVVRPHFSETHCHDWFHPDKASINLIRSFAGRGTRIWGCRTLAGTQDTRFRYVQVRRTVTWIEASLRQICRFAIFEPNHEITWFHLRGLCNAWLRRLWLEGGLAGSDEASAYTVRVGLNESMTAEDLAEGRLIVMVGVAVLHAAEFIEVKLIVKVGDEQTRGADLFGGLLP